MKPFAADFAPSRWRRAAVCVWGGGLAACAWAYFEAWRAAGLTAAVAAATAFAWREGGIRRLTVDENGKARLHFADGGAFAAELLSGSLISPAACLLKWRCGGRIVYLAVLPDMLPRDTFRRLRVWARFAS